MLQPKRTKYRKTQKGRNEGLAYAGSEVSFGDFGLKATSRGELTAREIEAARRAFTREMKRVGKVWIRVFPDKPITQKALGVRMGKGKAGFAQFSLAKFSLKSVAFLRKLHVRLSVLLQPSCRLPLLSFVRR